MAQDPSSRVASWITQPKAEKADLDPMIALSREWTAIEQEIIVAEEANDQARLTELAERTNEVEDEISKLVSSNLAGILCQARVLDGVSDFDLERVACTRRLHDDLIANMIAGLERLVASNGSEAATVATAPDDSRILALFREWIAANRYAGALYVREMPDKEVEKQAWAHVYELHRVIVDTPAAGVVGIAIKAYLEIHDWDEGGREDSAAVSRDSQHWQTLGLLKDVVRFVPELAPLAANALKEPDADDAEAESTAVPEILGFGEPEEGGAA